VVGIPDNTTPWEIDYPLEGNIVTTAFPTNDFSAGPSLDSWWRKTLFALRFGDEKLVLSNRVTEASQILYVRDPAQRVAKVAPWLTLDSQVYPAVVAGRLLWIVDGYTTTDLYPYAKSTLFGQSDQNNSQSLQKAQPVNYVRNAVKATVDAYDGSVRLYAWDPADPLLLAWSDVFRDSVAPMSEISGALMSHLRYPPELFNLQAMGMMRFNPLASTGTQPQHNAQEVKTVPQYATLYSENGAGIFTISAELPDTRGYLVTVNSAAGNSAGVKAKDYGALTLWQKQGSGYHRLEIPNITSSAITSLSLQQPNLKAGPADRRPATVAPVTPIPPVPSPSPDGVVVGRALGAIPAVRATPRSAFGSLSDPAVRDAALDPAPASDPASAPASATAMSTPPDTDATESTSASVAPTMALHETPPSAPATPTATSPEAPSGFAAAEIEEALMEAQLALVEAEAAHRTGDEPAYTQAQARLQAALNTAQTAAATPNR
ncbi:MAG: UPF0182 family protein, partial [Cellulomonadaceae bacterium]|nr:UPF0182 family protein [Cellulomonadaceae bacterium]